MSKWMCFYFIRFVFNQVTGQDVIGSDNTGEFALQE